ncbi:cache domain-containing protein, partial [Halomonas citrativorans]
MTRLTTNQKLWSILGIICLAMLTLVGWLTWETRQTIEQERRNTIQNVVESLHSQLGALQDKVASGELTLAEAQQRGIDSLANASFAEGEYLFAFDDQLKIVSHPNRPLGEDMSGYQDTQGMHLYAAFLDAARSGGGHVDYFSRRISGDEQFPKISYFAYIPEWNWAFGAGVYVDDIRTAFVSSIIRSLIALLIIGIPVAVLMSWVIRDVSRRLGGDPRYAATVVRYIADGDLTRSTQ